MHLEKITTPGNQARIDGSPAHAVSSAACVTSRHYAGYVDNISRSGAKPRSLTPIGRIGDVMLRVPDLESSTARLCWSDRYNGGVSFNMPPTARQLIVRFQTRSAALLNEAAPRSAIEIAPAQ